MNNAIHNMNRHLIRILAVWLFCALILQSIAIGATAKDSDSTLKIHVKSTKFFHRALSLCSVLINVSNIGSAVSEDYFVSIEVYTLFTYGQSPWFLRFHNHSFTGSSLEPSESTSTTTYEFIIWGTGWYLVRATITSNGLKEDVDRCLLWVQFR